jgi:hypothetical protein
MECPEMPVGNGTTLPQKPSALSIVQQMFKRFKVLGSLAPKKDTAKHDGIIVELIACGKD